MRFSILTIAAAFTGIASAYTTPVGQPNGNPIIKPGLNDQVPVGKPYNIQWEPTTPKDGTVTLVLLRGPAANIKPLYPIVEKIPNSGSYEWTPKSDLEADKTHYAIKLIVDATGQYQYTSQFGIINSKKVHYPSGNGYPTSSNGYPTSGHYPHHTSGPVYPTGKSNSTIPCPTGTVGTVYTMGSASTQTGLNIGPSSATNVGGSSTPASSPTQTASTGAAARNSIAIGAVAAVVVAFAGL